MSTAPDHTDGHQLTRSCVTELVCHKCDLKFPVAHPSAFCPNCGKSLDFDYDYERAAAAIRQRARAMRMRSTATTH